MKASKLLLKNKLKGRLIGEDVEFSSIKPIYLAKDGDLTFMLWPQDIKWAKKSKSLIITTLNLAANFLDEINTSVIVVEDIFNAFLILSNNIKKIDNIIHETAKIHKTAVIENAIIGPNVEIGANSVIGSHAFVPYGEEKSVMLPSLGHVFIEDNTKIGALCSIQKGLIEKTFIGKNTYIDDQVHIGHDSYIENNVIIAGKSALAGFVHVQEGVTIGGQVGVAPFVKVGKYAKISGKSGVIKNVKDYQIVSGIPAIEHRLWLKLSLALKKPLG